MLAQSALADISISTAPVPHNARQVIHGNCDLMASNTVRAIFQGMQQQDAAQTTPITPTAVFQVQENLAHRRYVRYGDGLMPEGMLFTVCMDRSQPGQPAQVVDEISQMKPGDEAIMKVDHLFIFAEPQGQNVRPCTRIARRTTPQPAADAQPAAPNAQQTSPEQPASEQPQAPQQHPLPTTVAPLGGGAAAQGVSESFSTRVFWKSDGKGGITQERVDVKTSYNAATGQTTTRMFINGEEVDPNTRQPLNAAPQPAAAPQQEQQAADDKAKAPSQTSDSDTIVE